MNMDCNQKLTGKMGNTKCNIDSVGLEDFTKRTFQNRNLHKEPKDMMLGAVLTLVSCLSR